MAREESEVRLEHRGDRVPSEPSGPSASLGDLFKQLTTDTGDLIRQEARLARTEIWEAGTTLVRDAAKVGIAVALALAGALAVAAFLVVGLGALLDGRYWLSALLVGIAFLAGGGVLARNAVEDVKRRGLKPNETVDTLREDAVWAKREARELKRELRP
jgi:uncharacterized membrane protein YqjE